MYGKNTKTFVIPPTIIHFHFNYIFKYLIFKYLQLICEWIRTQKIDHTNRNKCLAITYKPPIPS